MAVNASIYNPGAVSPYQQPFDLTSLFANQNAIPFGMSATGPYKGALTTANNLTSDVLGPGGPISSLNALASQVPLNYTPQQESQILGTTLGGIQDQAEATRQRIMDAASRTGASASLIPALEGMGYKTGSELSRAGGTLAKDFAAFPAQQLEALSRAIYSPELSAYDRLAANSADLAGRLAPYAYRPTQGTQMAEGAGGALVNYLLSLLGNRGSSVSGGSIPLGMPGVPGSDIGAMTYPGAPAGPALGQDIMTGIKDIGSWLGGLL